MTEERAEKVAALQAIIFAAESACDEERLALVLDVDVEDIEALMVDLGQMMEGSALQVVRLAGGYQMATRPRYASYVQRLREPEPERLSPQALETLAIVAYLQPITRPEIDEIRGVNSTGCINSLLEKGLVEISGRKEAPGRPFVLGTTSHFLSTFGLNDLDELPELSHADGDFQDQLRELVSSADIEAAPDGAEGEQPEALETDAKEQVSEHPGEQSDPGAEAETEAQPVQEESEQ